MGCQKGDREFSGDGHTAVVDVRALDPGAVWKEHPGGPFCWQDGVTGRSLEFGKEEKKAAYAAATFFRL